MAEDKGDGPNYIKEAFLWQYNKIVMIGAVAFAVVSGSALPLLLGAGLEMMYLSTIPNNKRFQRLVRSWKFDEDKREREKSLSALFYELPQEMRARYANLDTLCRAIRQNYTRLNANSQMFVDQMESKLEGLSQSYIRLLNSAFQHREYLRVTNLDQIKREYAQLEKNLPSDPPKVQEINRKRVEILKKRVEKYTKVTENRQVIDAQCAAIEDVLQLIRDQSVTMRDPQTISDHLDNLVKDVEATEETVRDVEAIFDLSPLATQEYEQSPEARTRIRN
ncbi:MAG TPA: hypothetical protein VKU19_13540 [Bryobacteraceae bacterium]|nr:hypothetical protein [Bryobacteraceae bacterium]